MYAITRNVNLDLGKPGQQSVMYAKRGDTRFYCLLIRLQDDTEIVPVPSDATVVLLCKKPDGTLVTLPGQPDEGKAKVYLSAQTLTAAGIVNCQLQIIGTDDRVLYSPSFDVVVDDCVLPEDAMVSSSEFGALSAIVQQVRGLVERVALSIVGVPYPTIEALHAAVPQPYPWSMYAVGEEAPYDIYRQTGDDSTGYHGWVSHGTLQGAPGTIFFPEIDSNGNLKWTNNGALPNPEPVRVVGNNGDPGSDGATFTPTVDENGMMRWTNNKQLENPPPRNVIGPNAVSAETASNITGLLMGANGKVRQAVSGADYAPPVTQHTATVRADNWQSIEGIYIQGVTISGLTAADAPLVDVVLSDNTTTALAELEAYGYVGKISVGDDNINVVCYEDVPLIDFTIILKVVR